MMENAMSIDEDSSKNYKFNKIMKKSENSESLIKIKKRTYPLLY